jgi:hypothetical protein
MLFVAAAALLVGCTLVASVPASLHPSFLQLCGWPWLKAAVEEGVFEGGWRCGHVLAAAECASAVALCVVVLLASFVWSQSMMCGMGGFNHGACHQEPRPCMVMWLARGAWGVACKLCGAGLAVHSLQFRTAAAALKVCVVSVFRGLQAAGRHMRGGPLAWHACCAVACCAVLRCCG